MKRPAYFAFIIHALCGIGLAGQMAIADDAVVAVSPVLAPEELEFFEKRVRPLLMEHCYECHSGEEQSGGLLLDSRSGWQAGGDSGSAIALGRPNESRLIEAVRYENRELQMPPSGRLAEAEIAALEEWVRRNAPDPRDAPVPGPSMTAGVSIEEGRNFWSFLPLADPELPWDLQFEDAESALRAWIRNPIDAFILAGLREKGLTPAPAVDKRTLIRRITFDLIGLPPSPEEIAEFLADDSPDAYEKLVERLLSSPHHGLRWGRHWLDVARYSDSNGLDENLAYGSAWRYRDYVIQAFNDDKPFNEFLVEQIAGDLLPDANQVTRTATGFLALGAKVLAEPDREKLTMDTVDEQIDTIGKAFLGMTLGCVRCHDHKFDPIKQRDYYALAAILKSTQTFGDSAQGAIKHWYEHSFASEEELERLKGIDAEIKARQAAATQFKNESMNQVRQMAVGKAAKYLAAAAQFSPDASLNEIGKIAEQAELHPRILYHCRLHLEYKPEAPLVAEWAARVQGGSTPAAIEEYFQQLIDAAATEPSSESGDEGDAAETALRKQVAEALADKSGLFTVPPQPEFAFDAPTLEQYYALMEAARLLESSAPDESSSMGVCDGEILERLPIHIRGSHRNLGEPVERAFPEVMWTSDGRPNLPTEQSGRLELARWMANAQHPLTARVYVNRIWGWHFGRALVGSTENFGLLGDRPSHPELLDWLASSFIRSGWSTKELHRLIVMSNTYQMRAVHPQAVAASEVDPENDLLWRFPLQRLDAEQVRDALLAISGRIDLKMGGKTVPLRNRQFVFNHTSVDHTRYDSLRRAVYLPVIRNNLYTLFEQFDFPDPTMPTGSRKTTVVAPQALLLMNDELILDSADAFAERVLAAYSQDPQRIDYAYELALGRGPEKHEMDRGLEFLRGLDEGDSSEAESRNRPWSLFCQSLMMSNEFIYLR